MTGRDHAACPGAVVFGARGGIGAALVAALAGSGCYAQVFAGARQPLADPPPGVVPFAFDLLDEASIAGAAAQIGETAQAPITMVIVATGLLHRAGAVCPEKGWAMLDPAAMAQSYAINTIGPALIGKHMLGRLARDRPSRFAVLSARVGSIGDNRLGGWHAYRAAKAGLNMLVRTFAVELARRNPMALAVALHPGTVATALSAPFQRGVPEGQLLTPQDCAARLLAVLDRLGPGDSGGLFAYDGQPIPW